MTRMLMIWGARAGALLCLTLMLSSCEKAGEKIKEEIAAANNPFPSSSPLHEPTDRLIRRLVNDPRYMALAQAGQGGEAARQAGAKLAMDGLPRLPLQALEQRAGLMSKLLGHMEVRDCAATTRATTPADAVRAGEALMAALAKLPQSDIDNWFEMSYQASIAELDKTPPQQVSEEQVATAVQTWLESLPDAAAQQRISTTLGTLATASDAHTCELGRSLFNAASTLPQPQRGHLAWLVTQQ